MITRGQDIHSIGEEFLNDERGDTKAARRILTVGDHKLDISFRGQPAGVRGDHGPARRGENISDKKDVHYPKSGGRSRRIALAGGKAGRHRSTVATTVIDPLPNRGGALRAPSGFSMAASKTTGAGSPAHVTRRTPMTLTLDQLLAAAHLFRSSNRPRR